MPSWLHADPEMRGGLKRGRTSTSFPAVVPGIGGPGPGLSPLRPVGAAPRTAGPAPRPALSFALLTR
eukprot:10786048-Alexandrium_andersonii.AAC.1